MTKLKEFFTKYSKLITFLVAFVLGLALVISTTAYHKKYKKAKALLEKPVEVQHDTVFAVRNIVYIDTIHVVDTVFNLIEVKGAPDTVYIEVAKKKNSKKKK